MRAAEIKLGVVGLVIVGLAVGALLQQQQLGRLRAENAALRKKAGTLAALQTENQWRAGQTAAAAETAQRQAQQAELLRLRGEVTRLRNEARQNATRAPAASPQPPARTASAQPETNAAPFTATATVNVGSGQTFATGGWLTAPGSRTFLLATPTVGASSPDGKAINVTMCLFKVAESDLPESLLRQLQNQAPNEAPVLTGTEAAFLLSKANSGGETNIVSRPRIATSDGVPASLFVGQLKPNPDGTEREVGTKIDLSPQLGQDGQTITMGVNLQYVPRDEDNEGDSPAKAN